MQFFHNASGRFQVAASNISSAYIIRVRDTGLDIRTTTGISDTTTWHHILCAWDRGNGVAHMYLDGNDDLDLVSFTNANTDYTRFGHAVGSLESVNNLLLKADFADFWLAQKQFLDISLQGNRERFRDALGKPVDLGSDGSKPTGTAPIIFFKGDATVWNAGTNAGTAQDFTMVNSVTDSSSSPSD